MERIRKTFHVPFKFLLFSLTLIWYYLFGSCEVNNLLFCFFYLTEMKRKKKTYLGLWLSARAVIKECMHKARVRLEFECPKVPSKKATIHMYVFPPNTLYLFIFPFTLFRLFFSFGQPLFNLRSVWNLEKRS